MVTLEECRKIFRDNDENISDEEILKIREFLCKMARIVIETKTVESDDK